MEPTLREFSFIVVDKFFYNWNLSYFLFFFTGKSQLKLPFFNHAVENLQVGDLVVFDFPDPITKNRTWIKRLIAKENDTYAFKDKKLYINEKIFPIYQQIDFLPEAHSTPIFELPPELKSYPPHIQYYFTSGIRKSGIVPKDTFLLLGDNHTFSRDSRIFGFIPKDRIIGRVIYVF